MIELAFMVCLRAEPTTCENRAMQFADMSMTACVMGAQPQLALWQSDHPDWVIQGWSCRPLGLGRSI